MRKLTENILINENPEVIWETLLKFHEYENWNPVFNYVTGEIGIGETIAVEMELDVDRMMQYADEELLPLLTTLKESGKTPPQKWKFKVTELVENELMVWKMSGLFKMILGGRHDFRLGVVQEGKTMFEISIAVGGLLGSFMPDKLFYTYNKALLLAFLKSFKWYVEEGRAVRYEVL